ncbi:MAG: hypothetical protein K9W43_07265 [Candidatus Thorarchaeota archaeon]|nr:hypothetical protein [Candidatus Thorarchaeota archaeon]
MSKNHDDQEKDTHYDLSNEQAIDYSGCEKGNYHLGLFIDAWLTVCIFIDTVFLYIVNIAFEGHIIPTTNDELVTKAGIPYFVILVAILVFCYMTYKIISPVNTVTFCPPIFLKILLKHMSIDDSRFAEIYRNINLTMLKAVSTQKFIVITNIIISILTLFLTNNWANSTNNAAININKIMGPILMAPIIIILFSYTLQREFGKYKKMSDQVIKADARKLVETIEREPGRQQPESNPEDDLQKKNKTNRFIEDINNTLQTINTNQLPTAMAIIRIFALLSILLWFLIILVSSK